VKREEVRRQEVVDSGGCRFSLESAVKLNGRVLAYEQ